jgi:hypothetical protein
MTVNKRIWLLAIHIFMAVKAFIPLISHSLTPYI